ncbi:MAG: glycosyltransferase family 4 protein [Gaiellaceae bacterium]
MIRVVFVFQEPTPYRTPQFEAFAALPEMDTTIVYAARTVQQRTWDVPPAGAGTVYLSGPSLPLTRILQHDYAMTPAIWPLLNRLRPHVLVIGGWSLMATQLAVAWARAHRVPYLLVAENHLLEPRPHWVRAVKRAVLPLVVPQAAGWLVPGRLGREHMLHYGARSEGILTFPLTIDVAATERRAAELAPRRAELRREFGIPDDAVAVLHAGRLIPQKAVDVLVLAVGRANRGSPPLHLLLAGSGPEEHALRTLVAGTGVSATFTGFLDRDRLFEAYAAADIFALLSRRETWGVVVNEAAAFGLPLVLSSAVGAAADLLRSGSNGEVVPSGDVDAAARALRSLAASSALREDFGRCSRELVRAWDFRPSVEALDALVRELAQ